MKKHSIIIDLLLILFSFGIWNLWMQYRQIRDINKISNKKFSFFLWLIFTILTFGIYHVYHEYKLTKTIAQELGSQNAFVLGIISALLSVTGLWILVDLFQQDMLNDLSEKN